jgi:hypothetical protein
MFIFHSDVGDRIDVDVGKNRFGDFEVQVVKIRRRVDFKFQTHQTVLTP